jgi:hypothetical protein
MRTLLLFIFMTLLLWQSWPQIDAWLLSQGNKAIHSQEKLRTAHKRTVYVLDRQRWTEFVLLPKQPVVRVLSNATIPLAQSLNHEQQWQYALQYQILDKDGHVLAEHDYHHRTRVTVYQQRYADNRLRPVFYIDPNKQPSDGRNMLINLSDTPNAARLRLRLHSADTDVIDVAIRVFWRQTWDEYKLDYLWHRLNDKQKRSLARGSLYEVEFLQPQEKRNLLRERWAVIGPVGVAGQEYQPRDIYVHEDIEGEIIRLPVESYGVFVDAYHWITLPLLEQGGRIHLRVSDALPLPGQTPTEPPVAVSIKWYGRSSTERRDQTFIWDGTENGFEQEFAGGLLEISASQPVMMRVFLRKTEASPEITPPPVHSSATLIQKEMSVDFQINSLHHQATPVRVTVRRLFESQLASQKANRSVQQPLNATSVLPFPISPCSLSDDSETVTYTLLDANEKPKKTGMIPLTQQPRSFYDRMTKQWWGVFDVSEADSYYLSVPPEITTLRLTSSCATLVTVYNRPADLVRTVRIPEDYYNTLDNNERQPNWFRLRPKNMETLAEQQRFLLIRIQRRPPRDNDEKMDSLLAGRYTWEDYRPIGQYRSRYLLVPRDSELPIRDQALGAFYQQVPPNRPVTLQFINARRTIQPNLIYQRSEKSQPVKITVWLDNQLHYQGYLIGKRGDIKLPKLRATQHRLILRVAETGQFFMNHAKPKDGQPIYIKRLAHRFDSTGLRFMYQKRSQDKELISARVYSPKETQERLQIQVQLNATTAKKTANLHSGWTFSQRWYDLRPAGEGQVMVLNTRDDLVDIGQYFIIPLQDDLPPGQYQIELTPQHTSATYLTLSKITLGLEEQRQFFQETQPY